jgi:hypothetical protein
MVAGPIEAAICWYLGKLNAACKFFVIREKILVFIEIFNI